MFSPISTQDQRPREKLDSGDEQTKGSEVATRMCITDQRSHQLLSEAWNCLCTTLVPGCSQPVAEPSRSIWTQGPLGSPAKLGIVQGISTPPSCLPSVLRSGPHQLHMLHATFSWLPPHFLSCSRLPAWSVLSQFLLSASSEGLD